MMRIKLRTFPSNEFFENNPQHCLFQTVLSWTGLEKDPILRIPLQTGDVFLTPWLYSNHFTFRKDVGVEGSED